MIYHLINHLVNNAIKFTEHGKIIISARVWSDVVEVTVEDTGRGLDEKTRERVFEKFYKETPSAFDRESVLPSARILYRSIKAGFG